MTRGATASAIAALCAGLLGFFLGRLGWVEPRVAPTATPEPSASAPAPLPGGSSALITALLGLSRELEELRIVLRSRPEDSAPTLPASERAVVQAEAAPAESPKMLELLSRIAEALEANSPAVALSSALPPRNDHALAGLLAKEAEDDRRQFVLWSVADLIQHFGRPDRASSPQPGTIVLSYQLPEGRLNVSVVDGLVLSVSGG